LSSDGPHPGLKATATQRVPGPCAGEGTKGALVREGISSPLPRQGPGSLGVAVAFRPG